MIIHHVGWSGVRLSSMIQAVRLALCFIGIETACTDAMNMIPTNRRMQLAALAGAEMLSVLCSDVPRGHIDSFWFVPVKCDRSSRNPLRIILSTVWYRVPSADRNRSSWGITLASLQS